MVALEYEQDACLSVLQVAFEPREMEQVEAMP